MKKIILLISLIVSLNKISSSANLDSGLVAYYPFNGNANDESGNGHNGTVVNAILTFDRFNDSNRAYNFPGISDNYISTNFIGIPGANERTVSLWIRTTTNTYLNALSWGGPPPQYNPGSTFICGIARIASGKLSISIDVQDAALGYEAIINDFNWHHYVWVVPEIPQARCGDIRVYQDGVQLTNIIDYWISIPYSQNTLVNTIASAAQPVKIGIWFNSLFFNGQIDDVRIYNRAISNSEINQLYQEGGVDNLNIKVIPQGFYSSLAKKLRMKDTVQVFIRQANSPYSIRNSSKVVIDSLTFQKNFVAFVSPAAYYIVVKHRNCIETWSSSPVSFSGGALSYNFTSAASQAYGNNLKQVDNNPLRFGIYSGDVNQDGIVDMTDLSLIENDAKNFRMGYVATDLTGDNFVDIPDLSIADNNAYNFVSKVRP